MQSGDVGVTKNHRANEHATIYLPDVRLMRSEKTPLLRWASGVTYEGGLVTRES